jgi:DNA primase large subunit
MVSISFLNPLSPEGKDIVRELVSFEGISKDIPELRSLVTHNPSQEIVYDQEIPSNYLELALKRMEWYIQKKHDREFNSRKYAFLSDYAITKYDVISFYLLCQAIGVKFGPNSRETRVMVEAQGDLVQERLGKLRTEDSRFIVEKSLQLLLKDDLVHWTFFQELLSTRKIRLTDLLLDSGELILDREDFLDRFGPRIKQRNPSSMYELLIGDELKELIMVKMIMQETEDYIKQVHEKARIMVEPNPILLELADEVGRGTGRANAELRLWFRQRWKRANESRSTEPTGISTLRKKSPGGYKIRGKERCHSTLHDTICFLCPVVSRCFQDEHLQTYL